MDEEIFNAASYGVKKQAEGKNLVGRIGAWVGFIAFSIGYCLLFTVPVKMPALIALLPIFLLVGIAVVKRRLAYEIEYQIEHGELKVSKLFNNKKRKVVFTFTIKQAEAIAPVAGELPAVDRVKDWRGSVKSTDSYYMLYRDADGKKVLFLFEGAEKLLKMMRHYNENVVLSDALRH